MISQPKEYRIKYKECPNKEHTHEIMNFVCLEDRCNTKSLICSICREEEHKGHSTKPLKFYVEWLKKIYEGESKNYNKEIESIDEMKCIFLNELRKCVEKVAEEFKRLEEDILVRFDDLNNQILEQQSRENKFTEFYQSLSNETEDNPEFLIQNYLPNPTLSMLNNQIQIKNLHTKISEFINETHMSIFGESEKKSGSSSFENEIKFPLDISKVGNIFTQTSHLSKNTFCYIPIDLIKSFQHYKLFIKIIKLKPKKGSSIHIGAIQKPFCESLNFTNPFLQNNGYGNDKIMCISNLGFKLGIFVGQLKGFSELSKLTITMTDNIMKISLNKQSIEFTVPKNGEHCFFFNLQGESEIELTRMVK